MPIEKKVQFNTYIPEKLADRVKHKAKSIRLPVSWIVDKALNEWLEKNENGVIVEEPA